MFSTMNNPLCIDVGVQVLNYSSSASSSEQAYCDKFSSVLQSPGWLHRVFFLADAAVAYLQSLQQLPWRPQVPAESERDIGKINYRNESSPVFT